MAQTSVSLTRSKKKIQGYIVIKDCAGNFFTIAVKDNPAGFEIVGYYKQSPFELIYVPTGKYHLKENANMDALLPIDDMRFNYLLNESDIHTGLGTAMQPQVVKEENGAISFIIHIKEYEYTGVIILLPLISDVPKLPMYYQNKQKSTKKIQFATEAIYIQGGLNMGSSITFISVSSKNIIELALVDMLNLRNPAFRIFDVFPLPTDGNLLTYWQQFITIFIRYYAAGVVCLIEEKESLGVHVLGQQLKKIMHSLKSAKHVKLAGDEVLKGFFNWQLLPYPAVIGLTIDRKDFQPIFLPNFNSNKRTVILKKGKLYELVKTICPHPITCKCLQPFEILAVPKQDMQMEFELIDHRITYTGAKQNIEIF